MRRAAPRAKDFSDPFFEQNDFGPYEPSGILHFARNPIEVRKAFEEGGVDLVGRQAGTVYRARDLVGAFRVQNALTHPGNNDDTLDPPPGIPDAGVCCSTSPTSSEFQHDVRRGLRAIRSGGGLQQNGGGTYGFEAHGAHRGAVFDPGEKRRVNDDTTGISAALPHPCAAVRGDRVRQRSQKPADTVDVTKLDSGNYPTTPRDIEQARTEDANRVREAIRIGNATTLVMDVESNLIFERRKYVDRSLSPKDPPSIVGVNDDDFVAATPGFMVGWFTTGQRRADPMIGKTVWGFFYTLRFGNAAQVDAALNALTDRTRGEPLSIPGYPAARGKFRRDDMTVAGASNAWLARGDLLLHVEVTDPLDIPADPAALATTKRAFDKQLETLKTYTPTPPEQMSSLPLDVDGLLSRTLALDKDHTPVGGPDPRRSIPRQAALQLENFPNLAKAAYDDAGVDYVATRPPPSIAPRTPPPRHG